MAKVLASGVFDRLHNGHLYFLKESKKLGEQLVVCITSDNTAKLAGKSPLLNEQQRLELVYSLKFVDVAFVGRDIGENWTMYNTIEEVRPDIISLGFDQRVDEKELKEGCEKRGIAVRIVRIGKLSGVKKEKNGKIVIS